MKTQAEVQDGLERFVARLNSHNEDLNLRVTVGSNEWVVEDTHEFPVPLFRAAFETGLLDVLDSLRVAAHDWGLTVGA